MYQKMIFVRAAPSTQHNRKKQRTNLAFSTVVGWARARNNPRRVRELSRKRVRRQNEEREVARRRGAPTFRDLMIMLTVNFSNTIPRKAYGYDTEYHPQQTNSNSQTAP